MVQKSTSRARFRYNQQTGQSVVSNDLQKAGRDFSQIIANQVGVTYAEGMYEELKKEIVQSLEADVTNEIRHVAQQYKRFIVGSSANQRAVRGVLTTTTASKQGGPASSRTLKTYNVGGTRWAPRKEAYLKDKQRVVKHQRWFEYAGLLGSAMSQGDTWTRIFGPVTIKIIRTTSRDLDPKSSNKLFASRGSQTYSVLRVEVGAFGKLTPAMLPALMRGDPGAPIPADGRTTGLISLVKDYNPSLADRIGGGPNVPYRPTLEPFLAFAMTRAIPAAVEAKIAGGLNSRTQRIRYKR